MFLLHWTEIFLYPFTVMDCALSKLPLYFLPKLNAKALIDKITNYYNVGNCFPLVLRFLYGILYLYCALQETHLFFKDFWLEALKELLFSPHSNVSGSSVLLEDTF